MTCNNNNKNNNKDHLHNYTSEMKTTNNNFLKSPPQVKTEPKEIKNTTNISDNIDQNQNSLLKKINEIKFNKNILNKTVFMSSPKVLPGAASLQKSSNLGNNQSINEIPNNLSNNQNVNTYAKFNKTFLNVGMIKNRKKTNKNQEIGKTLNIMKTLNNTGKFINLKKGKYKEFNPMKGTNQNERKNLNSQTNENISINSTSHNISINSNQIHLVNENRLMPNHENKPILNQKIDNLTDLEKILDEMNENLSKNKEKILENSMKFFDALKGKSKGFENLLLKGQDFFRRICEEYFKKCEKEIILKELIEKVNNENERLMKDSQENEGGGHKNNRKEANLNSSSTNYTNTGNFLFKRDYFNKNTIII